MSTVIEGTPVFTDKKQEVKEEPKQEDTRGQFKTLECRTVFTAEENQAFMNGLCGLFPKKQQQEVYEELIKSLGPGPMDCSAD